MLFKHGGEFLLRAMGLAAVAARREKIAVAALGHFIHRRWTARAGYPDRRERLLQRFRPEIDVAQGEIAALMGEGTVFGPRAHDQVRCFPKFLPRVGRRHVVIKSFRTT